MIRYFKGLKGHYKETILLGIPIVLGQLGIVLVGLADNIMVGRFATEDLAAASFVNSVFNIPIIFGLGFSYGLTPLVGQFFGRGDKFRVGGLLRNSVLANLLIGILLTIIMTVIYFNVHKMGQPEEILPLIRPYFLLHLASLVFVMMFNSFKQFADGITDATTPMWIMLSGNVLNIIGNFILIYGYFGLPAMGVMGAGISTLITRIYMFVIFALIFSRSKKYKRYRVGYKRVTYNEKDLGTLNRIGIMVGLQMGMETALFSVTGVMIGWLGTAPLAAHQIVVSVSTFGYMIYYGIGAAISIRVANAYGKGELSNVKKSTASGFHLILVLVIITSVVFSIFRNQVGYLFTSSEDVVAIVSTLIIIMIFFQFGDGLQVAFANSLRGIGDVTSMAVISFVGYFVIALSASYIFGFVLDLGIVGIWIGYPIGLTLTGAMLCVRYYYVLRKNRIH